MILALEMVVVVAGRSAQRRLPPQRPEAFPLKAVRPLSDVANDATDQRDDSVEWWAL